MTRFNIPDSAHQGAETSGIISRIATNSLTLELSPIVPRFLHSQAQLPSHASRTPSRSGRITSRSGRHPGDRPPVLRHHSVRLALVGRTSRRDRRCPIGRLPPDLSLRLPAHSRLPRINSSAIAVRRPFMAAQRVRTPRKREARPCRATRRVPRRTCPPGAHRGNGRPWRGTVPQHRAAAQQAATPHCRG